MQTSLSLTRKNNIVVYWLLTGVVMIIIQILIGGVTRLTGSGLSITEWKPIMGALPPMNATEWTEAFEKYQNIAQYKYLNNHFTLEDFKFIFFWEWFHRQWARLIGIVFIIPFLFFWIRGYFNKTMILPLIALFLLGILQALIGWIMVQSGLNDTDLYVNHIKLAIHFVAALGLLCYNLWFALQLSIPQSAIIIYPKANKMLWWLIVLLSVQVIYGAFMAGMRAATYAPTWPTINGDWVPQGIATQSWLNHPINVHFIHRGLAYILVVFTILISLKLKKNALSTGNRRLLRSVYLPVILIVVQLLLGIFSVLSSPTIVPGKFGVFEMLAESHQLVAMFLLMTLVYQIYLVRGKQYQH